MRWKFLLFFLLVSLASFRVHADDFSCQNFFGRFTPATPHEALTNSAYYLEYSKLGSVFIVMKEGLPYYPPFWRFGVFTHSYSPVTLEPGGSLSASSGSYSSFHRGDLLALAEAHQTDSEARLKLISYKKYSIKPGSSKETDRVTLELVIPKGSSWCTAQRSFETWLKGFGGMLEMERYQKIGEAPAAAPIPEASEKKASQKKSKEEKAAEREASSPEPAPVSPSPPPPVKKETSPPPAKEASPPPPTPSGSGQREISFKTGMSRSEVDAALGAPHQVMKLGDKSICYYDDVVIEFEKDKLTSIRLSDKPSGEVLKRFH